MPPPATPQQLQAALVEAFGLHQRGLLAGAAQRYDAILRVAPKLFDALHLRGVVALQQGDAAAAAKLIGQAVKVDPRNPVAHGNLGAAQARLGRFADAVASFDRAISLAPHQPEAHANRANALAELGRPAQALEGYDRALALRPDHAEALAGRAAALRALGRPAEALVAAEAAIALRPDLAEAHNARGTALVELGAAEAALDAHDRAIALAPGLAAAHANRGNVLRDLDRPEMALAAFERSLELRPGNPDAHAGRGNALLDLGRAEEALAEYDHALARRSAHAAARIGRGNALRELGRPEAALPLYDQALALRPGDAVARWNKGLALLSLGRLAEGFALYEARRENARIVGRRDLAAPAWDGTQDIAGRTLFLHWEQGLGDTIQFCRFAAPLAARGARVVMSVQDVLRPLLASLGGVAELIGSAAQPEAFDLQCALPSLPAALGMTERTIPAAVPYLQADPQRVARWRERLGREGFRIGICWQGSRTRIDVGRSFPLAAFLPLAHLPGVRLVSLHRGAGEAQLRTLPEGMAVEEPEEPFDPPGAAFLDSAAVMATCDLVITSDTAVAHLAGALGLPVWVVLKQAPDWRWMLGREDCPWYPTMRLFRQTRPGDWAEVFARVARDVAALRLRSAERR